MIAALLRLILVSAVIANAYAQSPSTQISKASALKNVGVAAVPGWVEIVSDENKFRVLFPGKPHVDDDVSSMKGFKFTNGSGKWAAFASDLGRNVPDDEAGLRELYQRSMDSMTRNKTYMLASEDITLNGRLGVEFRVRGLRQTSYTRAFAYGRMLYTLSVTQMKTVAPDSDTPPEVKQFFDSFAYWD